MPSGAAKSPTTTSQSAPNASGNNEPARAQTQSNQASPPPQAPSQAQSGQPSNSSNQAQTNTAPSTNNQSQASPAGANANTNAGTQPSTNTAAQPSNNQTNTAQSRSSNVSVSANLNDSQRARVSESVARLNVAPVNNVNFSLSVGTVVPRDVRFQPLPADVVEVMPQYRGYDFFVVRDDIVIVEPSTYKSSTCYRAQADRRQLPPRHARQAFPTGIGKSFASMLALGPNSVPPAVPHPRAFGSGIACRIPLRFDPSPMRSIGILRR